MNRNHVNDQAKRGSNEPDSKRRLQALEAGSQARRAGVPRHLCPEVDAALQRWWQKGWDRPHHPETPQLNTANPNYTGRY